ncbi:clip-domain serine protease [Culex quinquefasciatus]|uniref:Clip-domain serine protease n=1 Tax=Culex quinquefasciatus TaxID=7176 RepID=B0W6A7_CULQU|nr:clip-domain serine protease [Culex quinquefasciatus]|eukprot:XP_001844241.1 clip-domain serine protease [Culex quinquefasciatus]
MKSFLVLLGAVLIAIQVGGSRAAGNDDGELNPSKVALLPKECGVTKLGKTDNATKSLAFEFPWIALVRFNKTRRPATCLGSLINRRYVLSVIGCIRKTKKDPDYVRLGEQLEGSDRDCNVFTDKATGKQVQECAGPVLDVLIESYVFHPEFDQPMYTNDLALIRMAHEVEYNDYIRPICLPTTPELRANVPRFLVMPAWELDMNAPNHYVGTLEKYFVENIDLDTCQRQYENAGFTPEFDDGENRFCAGQQGPNYVCSRVPGSPIGTEVDIDGVQRHVEFAMAKFAPLNCTLRQTVPMISMRITKYMKWITDNLEA